MPKQNIEVFAERLVQLVRDRAIQNCSVGLGPGPRSPVGKRWASVLGQSNFDALKDVIIPDCIDEAIFCLLYAIDNEELALLFTAPDGQVVDLNKDGHGEMGGWYMGGDEGWRERFSREKIVDY